MSTPSTGFEFDLRPSFRTKLPTIGPPSTSGDYYIISHDFVADGYLDFQVTTTSETPLPIQSIQDTIEHQFNELARKWKIETGGMSSVERRILNPNYQRIIGLGKHVVPFIIRELAGSPDHWVYALKVLVDEDENPLTPEDTKSFRKSVNAWIDYGKRKGYV
jgi:hypothetical protein